LWLLIGFFEGKIIVMQETLLMIMCRSSAGYLLPSEKRADKRLVCELRMIDGVRLLRLHYCVPSLEQFGCCRGQRALLRLQIARPGTVATHFQRSDVVLAVRKHHRVVNPRGRSSLTAVEILRSTRHGSEALRVKKHLGRVPKGSSLTNGSRCRRSLSLAATICRPWVSSKLNIVTMDVFQRHSMKPHYFTPVAGW
jgi:hypothetical protein